jgi:hypothetical protein
MRIRWRSTAWSNGASSGLAGVGTGRAGARERRSQDRYDAREREREKVTAAKSKGMRGRRRRGMGSTPPRAVLFIGGPPNLFVVVPSTVQCASTALSQELRAKIQLDFLLRPKSEYRSSAKKTTLGRPDGTSFHKPPRPINIGLWQIILPNRPSTCQKRANITWITPRYQAAYDLIGSRIRGYTSRLRPHWIQSGAEYIARLLLAPGP